VADGCGVAGAARRWSLRAVVTREGDSDRRGRRGAPAHGVGSRAVGGQGGG